MSDSITSGAYDRLITTDLAIQIRDLPAERVLREALENDAAPEMLAQHLKFLFRRLVKAVTGSDDPMERIRVSNRIVRALAEITDDVVTEGDTIEESGEPVLWGIRPESGDVEHEMLSPSIRLSESALLVNGRNQPSIGHEINRELTSSNQVDLLCSFVMNTGLNVLERNLKGVIERGGRIRVLTTTYMGATQRRALDRLVNLGAEVRISYDASTTRLHAKAWLLRRNTGATTAYIGSSNLSKAALTDGIEWNVRLAAREQDHIIDAISSTFENYWNDAEFESYDPSSDASRLDEALQRAGSDPYSAVSVSFVDIEVTPRPFQQEVLDQLAFQRAAWGKRRNLVAMATGTGKTIVAGLDFRRLHSSGEVKTMLFVAHRKEILQQSLGAFRTIMRDGTFGELFVDGQRPSDWKHVFGSIQSLSNIDLATISPGTFDMVIVDEFHHAAADSYSRLLDHLQPKYLLGLTATPERSDGRSIMHWFDHSLSAELRLWEAIDRQILSPFHYFGIHDNTDLEAAGITWSRGNGYDVDQLTNLYTGNDARVALVLEQLSNFVTDLGTMKCLGFCVSVKHADYMAHKFNVAGVPSVSVTSRMDSAERDAALRDFRSGSVKVVFAVDIFNEGVDIPEVDTILMLRPTESATVFLQQLGRGLRKSEGKSCLTVLDFVGNQNRNFRFDKRYGALLGAGRRQLVHEIEDGFPHLPSGCHIELDRVARDIVLRNLRQSLNLNKALLASELKNIGQVGVAEFLASTGVSLREFYRNGRSLTALKSEVFGTAAPTGIDVVIANALGRVLHIDDEERIDRYLSILRASKIDTGDPYTMMLAHSLLAKSVDRSSAENRLEEIRHSLMSSELAEVLEALRSARTRLVSDVPGTGVPLKVHATYSRAEIVSAFGLAFTGADVAGVRFAKDQRADLAFVTLNKTAQHFSPSTMYADTALSSSIFQWESQAATSSTSPTGQRYINHREMGTSFHLFVREWKNDPETQVTMPYMYLGPADYMSHEGSKPMRIRWHLQFDMPADVLVRSKVIAS